MQFSLGKHSTTFMFLVIFLIPKVIDLHVLEHLLGDDHSISCEYCDTISNSKPFNLFLNTSCYKDNKRSGTISAFIVKTYYNSPLSKIVSPTSIYNKPPPVLALLG